MYYAYTISFLFAQVHFKIYKSHYLLLLLLLFLLTLLLFVSISSAT